MCSWHLYLPDQLRGIKHKRTARKPNRISSVPNIFHLYNNLIFHHFAILMSNTWIAVACWNSNNKSACVSVFVILKLLPQIIILLWSPNTEHCNPVNWILYCCTSKKETNIIKISEHDIRNSTPQRKEDDLKKIEYCSKIVWIFFCPFFSYIFRTKD